MLVQILAKTKVKTEMVNIARNSLIMLNNLPQMSLKLLQEEQFKKQQKQLVIWLVIKLIAKLQKFHKSSQQNNSLTVTNENDKEIPKEIYTSPRRNIENY